MNFSYSMGISGIPMPCNRETFDTLVSSPSVAELITAYRHGDTKAKKKLPVFCFHATFKHNRRLSADAVPSGLAMVDFDNLTDEELWAYVERAMPPATPEAEQSTEVMLMHITPSGKGLRIVIKCTSGPGYESCSSISDYQRVFAQKILATRHLDVVTTDLARCSFCPRKEDILYLNPRLWTDEPERTVFGESFYKPQTEASLLPPDTSTDASGAPPGDAEGGPGGDQDPKDGGNGMQHHYKGIPLRQIFADFFMETGGLPEKGERNSRFYEAARALRYICDFNPAVIAAHLPEIGLPHNEVFAVCLHACDSTRATQMPELLQRLIDRRLHEAERLKQQQAQEEEKQELSARLEDCLPPLFRRFTALYPPAFTEAIVLALLPIVGTLATQVRAHYFVDGEMQSPSFITMVTAEQASGKSFARRLMKVLLKDLYAEDKLNHEVERQYREQLKLSRNTKKQPEKPKVVVRIVPPSVSIAKVLERMDQAEGKHIISFAEELDTVIKSNGAGAWSQKSDMYREAFDNSEYGQDYMSDNTYSATLPVYYNLLFCGTPRQTARFFKDVENGLVSRTCFAELPDQFGAELPNFGQLTTRDLDYIDRCVQTLRQAHGTMDMDFLAGPLTDWLENQRLEAIKAGDRARDTFRKRAAVIGFRAALTVSPLYKDSLTSRKRLTEFALCVADIVIKNQLAYAGEALNKLLDTSHSDDGRVAQSSIYAQLNQNFSSGEVNKLLCREGRKTPARKVIYLWRKNGLIVNGEKPNQYKKV